MAFFAVSHCTKISLDIKSAACYNDFREARNHDWIIARRNILVNRFFKKSFVFWTKSVSVRMGFHDNMEDFATDEIHE